MSEELPQHHGHPYRFECRYDVDDELLDPGARPRDCPNCRRPTVWCEECEEWHDGCIGHVDGATVACCGHGDADAAYVTWPERTVAGLSPEQWDGAREATIEELRKRGASEVEFHCRLRDE